MLIREVNHSLVLGHIMYEIIFYEDKNNVSRLWEFLDDLLIKSVTSKDARVQYKQIVYYIELLKQNGTNMPSNITKNIVENIWELRPGNNRVFYFYCKNNKFVLLHQFHKKTQKTPKHEIEKALSERDDFISRQGGLYK
jgi:phage-related protein